MAAKELCNRCEKILSGVWLAQDDMFQYELKHHQLFRPNPSRGDCPFCGLIFGSRGSDEYAYIKALQGCGAIPPGQQYWDDDNEDQVETIATLKPSGDDEGSFQLRLRQSSDNGYLGVPHEVNLVASLIKSAYLE